MVDAGASRADERCQTEHILGVMTSGHLIFVLSKVGAGQEVRLGESAAGKVYF